jgi:hypothetical protein
MNDRIRELYQQAHSIRYHDGDPMRDGNPPTVYWQGEKSAKKFAELIVKECLVVINQSNGVGDDDVIRISKDVEKHFGVEE